MRQTVFATDSATPLSSHFLIVTWLSRPPITAFLSHSPSFVAASSFHPPMLTSLYYYSSFVTTLLSCPPVIFLLSCFPVPASSSCSLVSILLSRFLVPTLSIYPNMSTLLFLSLPALSLPFVFALLSRSILGPALAYLISLTLRIFKPALSDELLCHHLMSPRPTKPLCLFPTLDLFSNCN